MQNQSGKVMLACKICSKSYSSVGPFKRHMKTHDGKEKGEQMDEEMLEPSDLTSDDLGPAADVEKGTTVWYEDKNDSLNDSSGELSYLLRLNNDSFLNAANEAEDNLGLNYEDDWFNNINDLQFESEFAQEVMRSSMEHKDKCNECKNTKEELSRLKQHMQRQQVVIEKYEKASKAAELTKNHLRNTLKKKDSEIIELTQKLDSTHQDNRTPIGNKLTDYKLDKILKQVDDLSVDNLRRPTWSDLTMAKIEIIAAIKKSNEPMQGVPQEGVQQTVPEEAHSQNSRRQARSGPMQSVPQEGGQQTVPEEAYSQISHSQPRHEPMSKLQNLVLISQMMWYLQSVSQEGGQPTVPEEAHSQNTLRQSRSGPMHSVPQEGVQQTVPEEAHNQNSHRQPRYGPMQSVPQGGVHQTVTEEAHSLNSHRQPRSEPMRSVSQEGVQRAVPEEAHSQNSCRQQLGPGTVKFEDNIREVTAILGDSVTHNLNQAVVERATSTFLHIPGRKGSNGAKTRRCYTARKGGRFVNNNYCEMLPTILKEARVDNLVMQAPIADITNLATLVEEGKTDKASELARDSSAVMVHLAKRAIEEYPSISKVIVIKRPIRLDNLESLSKFSNDVLEQKITNLNSNKILVAEHNVNYQGLSKEDVFGTPSARNDGVHMNGRLGRKAFTTSMINVLNSCGILSKAKQQTLNHM